MTRSLARQEMTLKSLELFKACAREGSFQAAATHAGLSISTVSHHMRALEAHLGAELFDHARRPMVLTPVGQSFLRNVDVALSALQKARAEVSLGNIKEASHLRIGAIEDFDSDIVPDLAVFLNTQMPKCEFYYHTNTSHLILDMLRSNELDLGITIAPTERTVDIQDHALLRDPFVIAMPEHLGVPAVDVVSGKHAFPLLRYSGNLIIARQIEAQLRRLGLAPPFRFESDNNQTLMAMVSEGAGWCITTPLLFSRARRFHGKVRLHRFPGRHFARTLSIVTTPECPRSIFDMIDGRIRGAIVEHAITPICRSAPWLEDKFALIQ